MKRVYFTKRLVSVFLAASVVFLGGCFNKPDGQQGGSSGGGKPSDLAWHWVHVSGVTKNKPESMELFKDGTGVVDKGIVTWKVENKRLVLMSSFFGLSCDYKISGYELTLDYDDGSGALFVKKDKL